MVDINSYVVDGSLKRDKIVADIKRGRLTRNDITELDKNTIVKESYFGSDKVVRRDSAEWNSNYLDELALASVSEMFNESYMLYLNEVATFVSRKEEKREKDNRAFRFIAIMGIVGILILLAILFISSRNRKDSDDYSTKGAEARIILVYILPQQYVRW